MSDFSTIVLVVLAAGVILTAFAIFGLSGRFKDLEAAKGLPDQALQMLQREIQASREESTRSQIWSRCAWRCTSSAARWPPSSAKSAPASSSSSST
jgi:hypothetical protein